jgi:hypothetical protein
LPPHLTPGLPTGDGDGWSTFVELAQVPPDLAQNPQIVRTLGPVVRADFALLDSYLGDPRDQRPLDVPLVVSRGSADPFVTRSDLSQWRSWTTAELLVEEVDGGSRASVRSSPSRLWGVERCPSWRSRWPGWVPVAPTARR